MQYDVKKRANYKNFKVFKDNRLDHRAYFIPFGSRAGADIELTKKRYSSDRVQLLNGEWDFKYYPKIKDLPDPLDTDNVEFDKIPVPGVWSRYGYEPPFYTNIKYPFLCTPPKPSTTQLEGVYKGAVDGEEYVCKEQYNSVGVYRTFIEITELDKRYILSFLGVAGALEVYMNGKYVGYSEGSHNTAEFYLDSFLREGSNELVAVVRKWSTGSYLEDQDMFRENGIFRDVLLFKNEQSFIFDFEFFTSKSNERYDAIVNVKVVGFDGATVSVSLTDASNIIAMRVAEAQPETKLMLDKLDVEEWSAEKPKLYRLDIVLMRGGKIVEYVSKFVGFKTVSVEGRVFLFNGRKIKLLGANHHDTDAETGYYMTPEKIERDIKLFKEYNMNAVRTSHYPPDPLFIELCDKYGLYVVDEADIETHGTKTPGQISDRSKWRYHYWDRVEGMFMRDRNSVSVTMWSLGNESGGIRCHDYCYKKLKAMTLIPIHYERAIFCRRGGYDVASSMYTSVPELIKAAEGRPFAFKPAGRRAIKKKPFFLCEYAHAMGLGPGNLNDYVEAFFKYDSLMGGCIWEFADHAVKHGEGKPYEYTYGGDHGEYIHDGEFCVDGLFYPDRTPSTGARAAKNCYRPLTARLIANGVLELKNRLAFRNTSYITCRGKVMLGGEAVFDFSFVTDIAPGQTHIYNLNFEVNGGDVQILLDYFDGDKVVATESVEASFELPKRIAPCRGKGVYAADEGGAIGVHFDAGSVSFSKESGAVIGYDYAGKEFLADRPGNKGNGRIYTNIYRAPTDNDRNIKNSWHKWGYDRLLTECRDIYTVSRENAVDVVVATALKDGDKTRFTVRDVYTVHANGIVDVKSVLKPASPKQPLIPKVGKIIETRPEFSEVIYFGAGPYESYPDFKEQSRPGVYHTTVDELYDNYIRPQESGNRTDIRYCLCMNGEGAGLMFTADSVLLNFNGKRYTDTALEGFRHREDIVREEDVIYYSVDGYMLGIGSNSCGPMTLPKYRLKCNRSYAYSFTVTPFTELRYVMAEIENKKENPEDK